MAEPAPLHPIRSEPMRTTPIRDATRFRLILITLLVATGCAGALAPRPGEPPGSARGDISLPGSMAEGSRSEVPCRWLPELKFARAALAANDLERAEGHFEAAFACAKTMPLAESRIRSSLGGLVRVATQHRRSGSPAEADRVMASVRSTVGDLGLHPSVTQALTDAYDARYDERTREKTRVQQPLAARGARNRLQRAPAGRHGFDRLIRAKASNHDIDPALVKAVVAAESNFDEHAVSRTGAQGLMQLMPRTAEELGVIFPFDPAQNLDGGVRYLRAMLDRFGDTSMALAAYNAGPDAVVRYGGIPPYPETQEYVERVLQLYATYQNDRLN